VPDDLRQERSGARGRASGKGAEMIEQLQQLCTVTWDGNLISKQHRARLVDAGYAQQVNGFNWITANGIIVLNNLNLLPTKVRP